MPIYLHTEDVKFPLKDFKDDLVAWIEKSVSMKSYKIDIVNYIFCSDDYLLQMNNQYLGHNYYTDIVTFNNGSENRALLADLFISTERVKDNAQKLNVDFQYELARVMIHGLLHLMGYDDQSEEDKKAMRSEEDKLLKILKL